MSGVDPAYHGTRLPYGPKREPLWRTPWERCFRRLAGAAFGVTGQPFAKQMPVSAVPCKP